MTRNIFEQTIDSFRKLSSFYVQNIQDENIYNNYYTIQMKFGIKCQNIFYTVLSKTLHNIIRNNVTRH